MVHFVFDIDNTLYSFVETGFGDEMHRRIAQYMIDELGFEKEAAYSQSAIYYRKYGLTAAGLHHDHGIDLKKFCRFVNQCSYDMLKPNMALAKMLADLRSCGHEVWYMTNADVPHAHSVLNGLGITAVDPTCVDRMFDCFSQWEMSEPAMQNKPLRGAYEAMQRKIDAAAHDQLVMIDDAPLNLVEPRLLGWKTVWVSHGKEWDTADGDKPKHVITNIDEFLSIVPSLLVKDDQ